MAKIMLVEDDTNLLEIYGARLLAEGYEVVSAKDGEEALAMAVKEKPDLIISDIMMPKISGFDMLDILRSTPETKNTKVIMMTALNQAEDKERADKLGADRYLVKSQVTLEDVAQAAKEALGDLAPTPVAEAPAPAEPTMPVAPTPVAEAPAPAEPTMPVAPTPVAEAAQSSPAEMLPPVTTDLNNATSVHTKVINPINDLNKQSEDLKKLIAEEESKDNTPEVSVTDVAPPAPAAAPLAAPPEPIKIPVIVPPVTPPTPQA